LGKKPQEDQKREITVFFWSGSSLNTRDSKSRGGNTRITAKKDLDQVQNLLGTDDIG